MLEPCVELCHVWGFGVSFPLGRRDLEQIETLLIESKAWAIRLLEDRGLWCHPVCKADPDAPNLFTPAEPPRPGPGLSQQPLRDFLRLAASVRVLA